MTKPRILLLTAFAFLLAHQALAQSQLEPQPQNKTSPLSAQQSPAQPTPTIKFPTPEQITKSIADGIKAGAKEYETRQSASRPDNSGWWFNLFLVIFTGGLLVVGAVQCALIFGTLKATQVSAGAAKTAAEAAKRSADTAMKIELPSIELAQFKLLQVNSLVDVNGVEFKEGANLPEFCGLVVNFTNVGRTNAEIFEQCVEWRACKALPATPVYTHQTHFPPGQLLKQGKTTGSLIGNNFRLSEEQRSAIAGGTELLWVYCYLKYLDFFGIPHEKRFCARWLGRHPHFGTPTTFVYDSATPTEYTKSY